MNIKTSTILLSGFIAFIAPELCHAQGETAVPFLTFPSSPEGNGMGGIIGSTISDNPMAVLANPGQLGMASLDHFFLGGFYPSSTTWLPGRQTSGAAYTATALSVGLRLNRMADIPFGLSVGLGYSHIGFDWGLFTMNTSGPGVFSWEPVEHTNNLSVGIGIDYYIKMGLGYTHKEVESKLSDIAVQGQGKPIANFSTYDLGMIAEIPVTEIIGKISGEPITFSKLMKPEFDLSLGYSRRNLGDDLVPYFVDAQGQPLPKSAILGVTYKAGLTLRTESSPWEIVSFVLAREAEDILINVLPQDTLFNVNGPGTFVVEDQKFQFQSGAGAVQFLNNVLLGEGNNHITLRKGWQINFLELFQLRGGSVRGQGVSYSTSGYGIRLSGALHLLNELIPSFSSIPFSAFMLSHVDIRYDHATSDYDDKSNLNDGVTYSGLSLIIK